MTIMSEFRPIAPTSQNDHAFQPSFTPELRPSVAQNFMITQPIHESKEQSDIRDVGEPDLNRLLQLQLEKKITCLCSLLRSLDSCSLIDPEKLAISLRQTVHTLVSGLAEQQLIGDAAFLDTCIAKTLTILGPDPGSITLYIHPSDYALIEHEHDTHYRNLLVQCDSMMARGTVRLVSSTAEAIDGLPHRLAILKHALLDQAT